MAEWSNAWDCKSQKPLVQIQPVAPNVPASLDTLVPEDEKCGDTHGRYCSSLKQRWQYENGPCREAGGRCVMLAFSPTLNYALQLPPRDVRAPYYRRVEKRYLTRLITWGSAVRFRPLQPIAPVVKWQNIGFVIRGWEFDSL